MPGLRGKDTAHLMMMAFWTRGTLLGVPDAEMEEAAGEMPGPAMAAMAAAGLAAPLETAEVAAGPVGPEGAAAPASTHVRKGCQTSPVRGLTL